MKAIEIEGVTKFYGKQKALDSIQLKIESGQVLGLLGPNGAGKSTLMKILTAFISPSSGTARIHGFDVRMDGSKIKKIVGYLPENNPLYPEMYVREYLLFVLRMYGHHFDPRKRVDQIIDLTGLGSEQQKKIGQLSKGYRQRVGLAQALIHDPKVLILDEPTSGLDPNQLVGMRKLVSSLAMEKTVILSTHIMQEVEALCDRVVILDKGKIVADDVPSNLMEKARLRRYYHLELKELISKDELMALPYLVSVIEQTKHEWLLEAEAGKDIREEIFQMAVASGFHILSLSAVEPKIEEAFKYFTHDKLQ